MSEEFHFASEAVDVAAHDLPDLKASFIARHSATERAIGFST